MSPKLTLKRFLKKSFNTIFCLLLKSNVTILMWITFLFLFCKNLTTFSKLTVESILGLSAYIFIVLQLPHSAPTLLVYSCLKLFQISIGWFELILFSVKYLKYVNMLTFSDFSLLLKSKYNYCMWSFFCYTFVNKSNVIVTLIFFFTKVVYCI